MDLTIWLSCDQLKDIVDSFLQEMQLCLQLMRDCISVVNTLSPAVLSQDPVYAELRKEERLTKDSGEILQAQVCILLSKIRSDAQNHNHGVTILVIFVFISFKEL